MNSVIDTERTRHFLLLREKLGIDKPLSFPYNAHNLDKSEKEACNLVAKASGEGRASPIGTIYTLGDFRLLWGLFRLFGDIF